MHLHYHVLLRHGEILFLLVFCSINDVTYFEMMIQEGVSRCNSYNYKYQDKEEKHVIWTLKQWEANPLHSGQGIIFLTNATYDIVMQSHTWNYAKIQSALTILYSSATRR